MHKKVEKVFRKILHWMEGIIAAITLIVMVGMILQEIYRMFTMPTYFDDIHTYLHTFLNILVGLEFVRMLIDLTPANTIEVLIVALSRQVIISHEDPISNICCVVNPEAVVIGGGVSKAGQPLLDGIRRHMSRFLFHAVSNMELRLATLGNDAGAIGAFRMILPENN